MCFVSIGDNLSTTEFICPLFILFIGISEIPGLGERRVVGPF